MYRKPNNLSQNEKTDKSQPRRIIPRHNLLHIKAVDVNTNQAVVYNLHSPAAKEGISKHEGNQEKGKS